MGKTIRRDKYDTPFKEGQTKHVRYNCRCSYCVGTDRKKIKEKQSKKEVRLGVQEWEERTLEDLEDDIFNKLEYSSVG